MHEIFVRRVHIPAYTDSETRNIRILCRLIHLMVIPDNFSDDRIFLDSKAKIYYWDNSIHNCIDYRRIREINRTIVYARSVMKGLHCPVQKYQIAYPLCFWEPAATFFRSAARVRNSVSERY